ncbi:MAG: nicotinamide-nucleotide amidohydrolase family protein, partial [Flavobacteriaceae bacterium]|nr:nicotinamide-nucleotide amidohydrolase family protein [Flavobacteriaceae bacterium]
HGKVFISLPGVPNEMKGLMLKNALPKLQESFQLPFIIHKTILTYGMGESKVAERIEDWENALPHFIKLAYLPNYGKVRLRLSAKGENKELLDKTLAEEIKKLTDLISDIMVGFDEGLDLEAEIGKLLIEQGKTVAVAESCTGGTIARMIASVPGASNYFIGSMTSYHERIKTEFLNISQEIIDKHSVVSAKVAEAMASGIKKAYQTDYAIGITGNAGPTTDNTAESVGKVFIAIASPSGIYVKDYVFGPPRQKVIEKASVKALELLIIAVLKNR